MQIFSSTLRNLWKTWELPVLVLSSLLLQVALIPMGYKRKFTSNHWLRWLLWLAYLSADWVATVSLGILSNYDDGSDCQVDPSKLPRYVTRALWAPFLLLHLGGPDTITAYSMQDNDLWLRHLLGLFIQAGLAFYVFLRSIQPSTTTLNFVAIPVFVAGIVKYGERTWVLRSACTQHLRDFLLSSYQLTRNSKRLISHESSLQLQRIEIVGILNNHNNLLPERYFFSDLRMLNIAHRLFEKSKPLFADLVLSSNDLPRICLDFKNHFDSKSAFKIIELELGFMYDFFYTKASVIHSRWGIILRVTSLSSIVVAITTFCRSNIHSYPSTDVCLTFILLFGALALEIYSILLLLYSDWCVLWLDQRKSSVAHLALKVVSHCGWSIRKGRWSNSVLQYNLITHCVEHKNSRCHKFFRSFYIAKTMAATSRPISDEIKQQIFQQLKLKLERAEDIRKLSSWILKNHGCVKLLGWSLELDLDESILVWHIATHLCYHFDHQTETETGTSNNSSILQDSQSLSNFLAYLLVHRHSLFPNGMGQIEIGFRATIDDAIEFMRNRNSIKTVADACNTMLELDPRILRKDVQAELGKNLLFYHGCRLAKEIQELEKCMRWEIISNVLVEMLTYTSCQSKWYEHVEQLGYGGDLLTHVCLLMHHLTQHHEDLSPLKWTQGT